MATTAVCRLGNVPGSGVGLQAHQGAHMGLGLGGGHGAHLGAGAGLLSCPAGSGLMPGLHLQSGFAAGSGGAKSVTAALGQNAATTPVASVGKAAISGGALVGGKSISLGLGIGLGLWGPLLLAGFSAAGAYVLWQSYQGAQARTEEDEELAEALGSR